MHAKTAALGGFQSRGAFHWRSLGSRPVNGGYWRLADSADPSVAVKQDPPSANHSSLPAAIGVSHDDLHPPRDALSFGPFRLFPTARVLERSGVPLALGDRALDILIVLVGRAGQVVRHRELIAAVWRDLVVDPSNLRVHMTALRRALGDRDGKDRYVANVTGQGYCFVAPVTRESGVRELTRTADYPCSSAKRHLVLPPLLTRMIGRDAAVATIAADLIAERFITIVGPGGMGKTTVAVAVAHRMVGEFADAVCFVDLGAVQGPGLVAATVASSLGLTIQTGDVVPTLLECLRTLRMLLVLDNCEHVVDAAATLAELAFREAAGVHILATSREALRVEGEHVYWLPPLPSPPPESSLKADEVSAFPAVRLFMERAAAGGGRFALTDQTAPIVAGICGRLDGIALAIELAAGRVRSHGISGTEELLRRSLGLDWQGRRTALPRHQTLRALLDWSYGFLEEPERQVLQRLTVFVGPFTLEAAQAVVCTDTLTAARVAEGVNSLVDKSLVFAVIEEGAGPRYRLLETTRVYAIERLRESEDAEVFAERHARYFTALLEDAFRGEDGIEPSADRDPRASAAQLGNVRAALEWCFSDTGSASRVSQGVRLAAASVPVFLDLSLLDECLRWSRLALGALDEGTRGGRCELTLQEALAITAAWTRGNGYEVQVALRRGLSLANDLSDTTCRYRLLVGMHIFLMRAGEFCESLAVAKELQERVREDGEASYEMLANWMRGSSEHFLGDQAAGRVYFERGFAGSGRRSMQLFGLDYRVRALVTFARVLWLAGSPSRAADVARQAIREATRASKPLNVCFALLYTTPVFLWCADLTSARNALEDLTRHPNWHALPSLRATATALKGELLIAQGDLRAGTALLGEAIAAMRADHQSILVARAAYTWAQGLAATGSPDKALDVINGTLANVEGKSEVLELPELLRVKALILLALTDKAPSEAEECLRLSLDRAQRQGAKSWELRTALTLSRIRAEKGDHDGARHVLAPPYEMFTEGGDTADYKSAGELLRSLSGVGSSQSTTLRE